MMTRLPVLSALTDCWNTIGISGDRSCPELVRHTHCRNCPVYESAAEGFFEQKAPEDYLDEWSRRLSAPVVPPDPKDVSVLIFRLGDEWHALSTSVVVEVTTTRPVHTVPHRSDRTFIGLINLRGQLQLLVSLRALVGSAAPEAAAPRSGTERLVVIRKDGLAWAFESEEVLEVRRFSRVKMGSVPSTLANLENSFSQAVIDWKGRSIGFLDDQRLFAALKEVCR